MIKALGRFHGGKKAHSEGTGVVLLATRPAMLQENKRREVKNLCGQHIQHIQEAGRLGGERRKCQSEAMPLPVPPGSPFVTV